MTKTNKIGTCETCQRLELPLTFHHLIPRTLHSKKWYKNRFSIEELSEGIDICEDCHEAIHQFIDEKTLGKEYNTKEKLLEHPKVLKFVKWVSKRNGKHKTVRANERR